MKKFNNITIGSDPELYVYHSKKGFVSSIGLIPGVKGKAIPMDGLPKGFGVQIDNVLAEYNIPPVTTREDFIKYIVQGKEWIDNFLKTKYGEEYGIKCQSSAIFPEEELQSDIAKEFGCSIDYNAWTEDENPKPNGESTNLRTAGTHIHVGYTHLDSEFPDTFESMALIRVMDIFIGVPSVLLDDDNQRRILYGKAGAFRLTSYGVEYRVPSGKFIENEKLIGWMYDQTMKAIEFLEGHSGDFDELISLKIIDCINNSDVELAKELVEQFNIELPS